MTNTDTTDIDICGITDVDAEDYTNKLIFSSLYLGFTTIVFLFLMTKLFKNLQMFPIKEKSGKLILMFVLFNYLFLISYPVLLIVNIYKEQSHLTQNWISVVLRFLYNFYVITYLMRALRIHYAYDVSQKLQGVMYEIIKNENILCLFTFLMGATLSLPPQYIFPYLENIYDTPDPKNEQFQENYRIQSLIVVLINQLILLFSLFLIRRAKTTFKIQTELVWAIILEFSFSLTKRCFGIIIREYGLNPRCCNGVPSYYAIDSLKIIALVSLTVVVPLLQVKINPQRFPYTIIADNFELFLSEPMCIDIFHNYLMYYDKKVQQNHKQKISYKKIDPSSPNNEKICDTTQEQEQNNFNQEQQMNTYDPTNKSDSNDNKTNEDEQIQLQSMMLSHNQSIRTQGTSQRQFEVNRNIQTNECYILWMDLTLILAKFNALNQSENLENPQLLENEIIDYIRNLLKTTNLETMMPIKLAQEIKIRFSLPNKIVNEPIRISQNITESDLRESQKRLIGVMKAAQNSNPSSVVGEEKETCSRSDDFRILQIAYEIRFLMFEILSKIFTYKFQKTRSFHQIRKQFSLNEETQFRLYNLNLTKEFR